VGCVVLVVVLVDVAVDIHAHAHVHVHVHVVRTTTHQHPVRRGQQFPFREQRLQQRRLLNPPDGKNCPPVSPQFPVSLEIH